METRVIEPEYCVCKRTYSKCISRAVRFSFRKLQSNANQKKSTEVQHDLDQLNTLKQNLLKEIESLEVRKSNLEKTLLLNGLEKRTGR